MKLFCKNSMRLLRKHIGKASIMLFLNISTQVISILGFVFIARIYDVAIIGDYLTYQAYVAILAIVSTGYYEQALFAEKHAGFIRLLKVMPIFISFFVSFVGYIFLSIIGIEFAFFIAVSLLSSGIIKTAGNINIIQNKLVLMSSMNLLMAPFIPLFLILAGQNFIMDSHGMVVIHAATLLLLSLAYFSISVTKESVFPLGKKWPLKMIALLRKYRRFPGYSMLGEFCSTFAQRFPIIIANHYFTASMAAYYGVANRVSLTPVSVFSSIIAQMFIRKLHANKLNHQSSLKMFISLITILAFFVGIGVVVGFYFIDSVTVYLFTSDYLYVADIIKWMAPYLFMLLVVSPFTGSFTVFEKQHYLFYNKMAQAAISIVGFLIASYFNNFMIGVGIFSIGIALCYMVYFFQIIRTLRIA